MYVYRCMCICCKCISIAIAACNGSNEAIQATLFSATRGFQPVLPRARLSASAAQHKAFSQCCAAQGCQGFQPTQCPSRGYGEEARITSRRPITINNQPLSGCHQRRHATEIRADDKTKCLFFIFMNG